MAPNISPAKPSNRDIRGFFGSGRGTTSGQGTPPVSSSGLKNTSVVVTESLSVHVLSS